MGQTVTPPLPPGFVVDISKDAPPLPPGFIADSAQSASSDPTHDMSALPLAISNAKTLAGKLGSGAVNTVVGAASLPTDLIQHPIDTLAHIGTGLASGIVNAPQAFGDFIDAAKSGDANKMGDITTDFVTKAAPTILGAKDMMEGALGGASNLDRSSMIRQRAIQSILKPNKAAFDFGADPVHAVMNVGPASDIYKLRSNVQSAIDAHEAALQTAISNVTKSGTGRYKSSTPSTNVESLIRAQAQPILDQSLRWGKRATAKTVGNAIDAYLDDLRTRRGTTTLTPADALDEKRFLNKEIKFNPTDVNAQNLNALKLGVYRSLNDALTTMVPDSAPINKSYSGLVEAKHLLDQRILERGNADFTSKGAFQTVVGATPEVAIKTRISDALRPTPIPTALKTGALGTGLVGGSTTSDNATGVIGNAIKTAEDYIKSKFGGSK